MLLFRLDATLERDPEIDLWLAQKPGVLGEWARQWFAVMRECGDEVRELLHDGHPIACFGNVPFAYVDVFTAHANVGFFQGVALRDPHRYLEGKGKAMRHVKLKPGKVVDPVVLQRMIVEAYEDIRQRVAAE
ncbi:hypothetical protein F183_A22490 [Bryobacterales bacterium F-183]|nr:hypothetical protein F183_A22490 [Bryobacterales bacterium F-183]